MHPLWQYCSPWSKPCTSFSSVIIPPIHDDLEDPENVIAVHCNSGKGRTGTAIATLLLYTGFVQNIDDGLKYYGWKRFSSGKGVT
jgi:protein-tyrosine phosphatase